jgi:hypothetical protein
MKQIDIAKREFLLNQGVNIQGVHSRFVDFIYKGFREAAEWEYDREVFDANRFIKYNNLQTGTDKVLIGDIY